MSPKQTRAAILGVAIFIGWFVEVIVLVLSNSGSALIAWTASALVMALFFSAIQPLSRKE